MIVTGDVECAVSVGLHDCAWFRCSSDPILEGCVHGRTYFADKHYFYSFIYKSNNELFPKGCYVLLTSLSERMDFLTLGACLEI